MNGKKRSISKSSVSSYLALDIFGLGKTYSSFTRREEASGYLEALHSISSADSESSLLKRFFSGSEFL